MGKVFDPKNYNCWHFVREAWKDLTSLDLGDQVPEHRSAESYTLQALKVANTMIKLDKPSCPCLVLMQRKRIEPHVGIFYQNRVLHLNTNGVEYRPLDQVTSKYPQVSFYADHRLQ